MGRTLEGTSTTSWRGKGVRRTEISKSTDLSEKVERELSKQNRYSPISVAVKTKSPWRSFSPSMITFSLPDSLDGPWTE